jgi:hypothetical protein
MYVFHFKGDVVKFIFYMYELLALYEYVTACIIDSLYLWQPHIQQGKR